MLGNLLHVDGTDTKRGMFLPVNHILSPGTIQITLTETSW